MMYDFQYRAPGSSPLGAFVPLTIEGAPDHGTVADARVWAEHYGLRISLLGSRGRWLCDVFPDGKVIGVTQRLHDLLDRADDRSSKRVWFDSITPSGVEMLTTRALAGAVEHMRRLEERTAEAQKQAWALGLDWQAELDGAKETAESVFDRIGRQWPKANALPGGWARAFAKQSEFGRPCLFGLEGGRAMSGKTAFVERLFGSPDEVRYVDDELRIVDYKRSRPTSLSYSTVASFRGQTCPGQFEVRAPAPIAKRRGVSAVSADLLNVLARGKPKFELHPESDLWWHLHTLDACGRTP
jgi:hypothetical protein